MAMIRVTPTEVQVSCDWRNGRPRAVVLGGELVPLVAIDRVRDETAAYQVTTGPRTVFEVRTPELRLVLAYGHRRRRWTVEALDSDAPSLAAAA